MSNLVLYSIPAFLVLIGLELLWARRHPERKGYEPRDTAASLSMGIATSERGERMEAVVKRRRPAAVVHGHVHKGVPYGEIGAGQATLEDFGRGPVPVFNVALPVTKGITLLEWSGGALSPSGIK